MVEDRYAHTDLSWYPIREVHQLTDSEGKPAQIVVAERPQRANYSSVINNFGQSPAFYYCRLSISFVYNGVNNIFPFPNDISNNQVRSVSGVELATPKFDSFLGINQAFADELQLPEEKNGLNCADNNQKACDGCQRITARHRFPKGFWLRLLILYLGSGLVTWVCLRMWDLR